MSDDIKKQSEKNASEQIRNHLRNLNAVHLSDAILAHDRTALAQGITLIESTQAGHSPLASEVIHRCLPAAGNSIRIGITGVPGVGKSTFIDVFGMHLISLGKKVAVLAIDPSSPLSKGSILGDKTRMDQLASHENAFVRPSPSSETLGGVARKTRETIILCEAAGFDVILIETVGVGQSETAVHSMTDFFLLLMLAGAGDQLQGIKRGIMEMCDGMLITKADGENGKAASFAKAEYLSALHLFPAKENGWTPPVELCSAPEKKGLSEAWDMILSFEKWTKERGTFLQKRNRQDIHWMHETIREKIVSDFFSSKEVQTKLAQAEQELISGKITAFEAARLVSGS